MTAGNAAWEIGLVRMTAPFFDSGGFLHDTFGMVMVLSWLLENLTLLQVIMAADAYLCHTHFAPLCLDATGHMLEVVVIEKDTLKVVDDDIDGSV